MRIALLPLTLLALAPLPAHAGDGPCDKLLERVGAIKPADGFKLREAHDGCVIENGLFKAESRVGWRFDRVVVEGDGLPEQIDALADAPPAHLPTWGRISIEGARFAPQFDNALANYITTIQQWPMDISASYRFDPEDGHLEIEEAQLTSLRIGKAAISAELILPKDTNLEKLAEAGSVGVKHIRLRLDNMGLFESMGVPSLAAFLQQITGEDDPARSIEQMRGAALTAIQADNRVDAQSKAALTRFVQALPHPDGFFTLDLDFEQPLQLGLQDLSAERLAQKAIAGATVTASYSPR